MTAFDESDALERTAGDRSILSQVIRFTLEDIPQIIKELELSLEAESWQEAARLAHKIKGSAGAVGARMLYLAALDMELAARDSDPDCQRFLAPLLSSFDTFSSLPAVMNLSSLDVNGKA